MDSPGGCQRSLRKLRIDYPARIGATLCHDRRVVS